MHRFTHVLILLAALPLAAQDDNSKAPQTALPTPQVPPKPHCDSYSMQNRLTLTFEEKACYWGDLLVTGPAISGAAFWGAVGVWRHSPPEWPQGMKGFGEQFGTRYTQGMVKSTATFLTGALFREDPRIQNPVGASCSAHSPKFLPRLGESLLRTVWIPGAGCDGGRVAVSRIAGSFASGFVSLAWQPPSSNRLSTAMTGSGTAFAGYIGDSVFSEFQGDIFRFLGKIVTSGKAKKQ